MVKFCSVVNFIKTKLTIFFGKNILYASGLVFMKIPSLKLIGIVLGAIFFGSLNSYGAGTLRVVTNANNPPYAFIQYGNVVGFDVDLARIIADRLGKSLELKNVEDVLSAVKSNECDMAVSGIGVTPENEFCFDFSIPYLTKVWGMVMINSGEFRNVPQGAYFPQRLLQDKTIGIVAGAPVEDELLKAEIKNLTIRRYSDTDKLLSEFSKSSKRQGVLYGAIVGLPDAQSMVNRYDDLIFYRIKFGHSIAVAFPKDSVLRTEVNAIITDLINEGKISELENKWEIANE